MTSAEFSKVDALLAAAKAGDSSALSALFGLYQNYIRLLAATQIRSRLRVRVSESDIAQETFMKAAQGFGKFHGTTGGEFVVWLRRILTRRIQYQVQQNVHAQVRDVRREVSLQTVNQWVGQSSVRLETLLLAKDPSPGKQLQNHERSVRVANALATVSEEHRDVLILRSIEGLDFPIVAERMQRSHGAVRMLWLRAVESLRDALASELGTEDAQ